MAYNEFGNGDEGFRGRGLGIAEHLIDCERGYAKGPERALMSALLFDGVQAYMNYATATSESTRTRYREAFNWITRAGEDYVFSFESVCEGLGIDAEFLRLGLTNACNSHPRKWRRSRRSC